MLNTGDTFIVTNLYKMHYRYFICIDSRSNELIKGVSNVVQDTSQKK
jgi:hypothetical protein